MKEASEKGIHSKRRRNPGTSAERCACDLSSDDVGAIVGICVAILIVPVAVAAHIIGVSLLLLLTRAIALLWPSFQSTVSALMFLSFFLLEKNEPGASGEVQVH